MATDCFIKNNAFNGLTGVTGGPITRPPDADNVTSQNGDGQQQTAVFGENRMTKKKKY